MQQSIIAGFWGPCVVDLAALRSAMQKANNLLQKIEPLIPVDLIIDH